MPFFLYKLIPPRPTFACDMNDDERAIMAEHAAHWSRLTEAGTALVFGPVADPAGTWGMAVVDAASEADVRALGNADPAVSSGVCTYDVHAMPHTIVGQARAAMSS